MPFFLTTVYSKFDKQTSDAINYFALLLQGAALVTLLQGLLSPMAAGFGTSVAAIMCFCYGLYKNLPAPYGLYSAILMAVYLWGSL